MQTKLTILMVFLLPVLGGCATSVVTGAVVGTAATVTKVAAKTTVGAGKLAYRGTKAAVSGTSQLLRRDDDSVIADDRASLPDPE